MRIILADTVITVHGWLNAMDRIGKYTLKSRKTPEELKEEKAKRRALYGDCSRVNPMRYEERTVISKNPNDPTIAYFLPGLWPRVRAYLDQHKIQYEIEDKRNPDIRPEPDYSKIAGESLRAGQDVALAMISSLDCGIINTTTAWGKSYLISLVCKIYPTLNIVVTTGSTMVVSTLYDYLCKQLPGQVGYLYARGNTTHGKRVVVTTLKSLPNLAPEKVQLLLCDECHQVADNQAGRDISKFVFCRRFGFSASPIRNDGSRIVMEALFGPEILKMTYQESVDVGNVTPMKYLMLPCPKGPTSLCDKQGLDDVFKKRFGYWCNQSRNREISRLVYDIKQVYEGQILIMVGSLEHAIQLHMLLPWFKVAHYGATDLNEMKAKKFSNEKYANLDLSQYKLTQKQLDIMRAAFAKGTLRYVICTKVFRQGVDFKQLAIIIRGDGDVSGVECIQIPGRVARLADGKEYCYLIDPDDTFSAWSRDRSASREKQYQEQQWEKITKEDLLDDLRRLSKGDAGVSAGE